MQELDRDEAQVRLVTTTEDARRRERALRGGQLQRCRPDRRQSSATLLRAEALAGASARRDRAGRAGQSNGGRGGGEQREKARRLGRESCVARKKGGRAAERAG